MEKILIIISIIILGTIFILKYRRRKIENTLKKIELSKKDEIELWVLANKCWARAEKEGIDLPSRDVIVCRLIEDPYTWIILKLGLRNREIYRCRMSLEDIASARIEAEEIKKEDD